MIFEAIYFVTVNLLNGLIGFRIASWLMISIIWFCRNLLMGDTLMGCWATVGVLIEKGSPKTSSVGKSYCIWKFGSLDESSISVFLFGDAYQQNCKEQAGTVFALFNCTVRKDNVVSSAFHILLVLRVYLSFS